jgi:hypothetical protein
MLPGGFLMFGSRYLGHAAAGLFLGGLFAAACSANDDSNGGGQLGFGGTGAKDAAVDGSGASGGSGGTDSGIGGGVNLDGSFSDVLNPDAACDLQKFEATLVVKPVDVIFAVDNSCSMAEEMLGIQSNINSNFAQIIQASGIDYRVILIGEHGGYNYPTSYESSLCIDPPLAGGPCPNPVPVDTPPINNPPLFYHYDNNDIESNDMWSLILHWYDKPDRYGLLPGGWKAVLRPDALKIIVGFSDDHIYDYAPNGIYSYNDGSSAAGAQAAAQKFDDDVMALDPAQFGTPAERNYRYYAIVGVAPNPATANGEYLPTEPVTATDCPTAVNVGWGHQGLAILSGGLRFPVCEGQNFDVVFQEIAKGVIEGAEIACEFPMPDPPSGKELDEDSITIEYTPSDGTGKSKFQQVDDVSKCVPNAFYIDGDQLKLCPDACTLVQGDQKAKIDILALCKSGPQT